MWLIANSNAGRASRTVALRLARMRVNPSVETSSLLSVSGGACRALGTPDMISAIRVAETTLQQYVRCRTA
jgi:hypothetical protein